MKQIHNSDWYKDLYQLRLYRHYLAEAQRVCNKARAIEDSLQAKRAPKLRIV